jgi:hypothetical protein
MWSRYGALYNILALKDLLDEFYAMSAEEKRALVAKALEGVDLSGLPRAAARFVALVEPLVKVFAAMDSEGLLQAIQRAQAEAAKIMSMLESASLRDFYELPPVGGLTLLTALGLADEKTAQKLISDQGKLAAAARHKLHASRFGSFGRLENTKPKTLR